MRESERNPLFLLVMLLFCVSLFLGMALIEARRVRYVTEEPIVEPFIYFDEDGEALELPYININLKEA